MPYPAIINGVLQLVRNETVKPSPTEYPPLLHTLQTQVGMVTMQGKPESRSSYHPDLDHEAMLDLTTRASRLRSLLAVANRQWAEGVVDHQHVVDQNFQACAFPVTKRELLEYIANGKRIDIEQAVAMAICYVNAQIESGGLKSEASDDFEGGEQSILEELMNDPSTVTMLQDTCMWRLSKDFQMVADAQAEAKHNKRNRILALLGIGKRDYYHIDNTTLVAMLQKVRRRREKLNNTQHLTLPRELLPEDNPDEWVLGNNFRVGQQKEIPDTDLRVVSKSKFTVLQRLLSKLEEANDAKSVYLRDVAALLKQYGTTSAARQAALEKSTDAAAVAYSFIAAQRKLQLKVVSDAGWTRFLVKGEGAFVLQNRPDVLTSFEDVLVRHSTDLAALSAISCPRGVRNHFEPLQEIEQRAVGVCEMMERYVEVFGHGKMENLVLSGFARGGSGRGPVDAYNALCDELFDCRRRAKLAGHDLGIGHVQKFLAKDIMAWNNAWADDAFAGGKIPGWVEYLARTRMSSLEVSGVESDVEII